MQKNNLSSQQYRELMASKERNSNSMFGNVWTEIDGFKFQSKAEANYYGILKIKKREGLIKDFKRGVLFSLVVNNVQICTYRADFVIYNHNGTRDVIDVKSEATEGVYSFKLKKKLMKALFNIDVLIIKKMSNENCICGHLYHYHEGAEVDLSGGKCVVIDCNCKKYENSAPSDPEKGMPETLRFTLPADVNKRGIFVIFCFENEIEVKARGISKPEIENLLREILFQMSK